MIYNLAALPGGARLLMKSFIFYTIISQKYEKY